MKFTKGIIIGSVITAGIMMMYADDNMNTKKMLKKTKLQQKKMRQKRKLLQIKAVTAKQKH